MRPHAVVVALELSHLGLQRGFAFAEMANEADAEATIQALDGTNLDGRELKVNEAKERQPRGGGGGRY